MEQGLDFKQEYGNLANEFLFVDWDGSIGTYMMKLPILITFILLIYTLYIINKTLKLSKRNIKNKEKEKNNKRLSLVLIVFVVILITYIFFSYFKYYKPQRNKWYQKVGSTSKGLYLFKNLHKKGNIIKKTINNLIPKQKERRILV